MWLCSQSLLTQLLTKKHARQASVVQEHGANGDPLVYANDKELVQRDREAVKAVSALEKVQEERNRGLLAPNTVREPAARPLACTVRRDRRLQVTV